MNKYSIAVFFVLMFSLVSPCIAEEENDFFDRDIFVFNNETELSDFFNKMEEYNKIDIAYSEEKYKAQKRITTEIVNGLTADEIGDIPVLSIGEALTTSFNSHYPYDGVGQVDDYLIVLHDGRLHSISLNSNSLSPPKLLLREAVEGLEDSSSQKLLIVENLLIIISSSSRDEFLKLSFYRLDSDGIFEFEQSYIVEGINLDSRINVIDNKLIVVSSKTVSTEIITEKGLFSSLTASRNTGSSDQGELVNIASKVKWVKSSGDLRSNRGRYNDRYDINDGLFEAKTIMSCPLDNLVVNTFECNVLNLLGLDEDDNTFLFDENSLYYWSESNPSLDYEKIKLENYSDFLKSTVGQNLFEDIENYNYKKTIYRVELDSGYVGGVVVDSVARRPIKLHSSGAVISGLLERDENESTKDKDRESRFLFSDYEFSLKPSELSADNYQPVPGDISHPQYTISVGDNYVLGNILYSDDKFQKSVFTVWNKVTNTIKKFNLDINVGGARKIENNLFIVGTSKQGQLEMQLWSLDGEPEILNKTSFSEYKSRYISFQYFYYHEGMGRHVFGITLDLPNDRDDEWSHGNALQSFQVDDDGDVTPIGDLVTSVTDDELSCDVDNCVESFEQGSIIFSGDYLYLLTEELQLVKNKYSSEEIKPVSRLNLQTGESSFESNKELIKESN